MTRLWGRRCAGRRSGLRAARRHGSGKDADPLLVLTEAVCERYGLPARLSHEEQLAGRLPEGHKVHQAASAPDDVQYGQIAHRAVG
jgi:hypothetical protein